MQQARLLSGICIYRGASSISHLFFADDSIVSCVTVQEEVYILKRILADYERASRQQVNFSKSSIFFSKNAPGSVRRFLNRYLGLQMQSLHSRYLGVPAILGRSKQNVFQFLLTKIQDRLSFWKAKSLSSGGKEKLSPPTVHIPFSSVADLINLATSSWKVDVLDQFFHPLTVQEILKIHVSRWNKSDVVIWAPERSGYGKEVVDDALPQAKYFPSSSFLDASLGSNPSWGWRSIWSSQALLCQGLRSLIGNGISTHVWNDHWVLILPQRLSPPTVHVPFSSVTNLINPVTSSWKVNVLDQFFHPLTVHEILKIHISWWNKSDVVIWAPERSVLYLAVSYSVKVQHFLWRCCLNALLVQAKYFPSSSFLDASLGSNPSWGWRSIWSSRALLRQGLRSLIGNGISTHDNNLVDSWSPPPFGIVKCNFGTPFNQQSLMEGGGAVFRNSCGVVVMAKFMVCQCAILCTFELGFSYLWFESDAKVDLDGVLGGATCPAKIAPICFDINLDLRQFSYVTLTCVRR
ncbi:uncharacterized protein LOC132295933 [Cornus florida]|uniref:uncharacterized protein LOC132295933 n=1 Tax=Cornus florida TaxID=4283 RepID=UPI00289BAEAB|nr:uncharacterized protein LOC132295933 [Cornus florida]